MPPTLHPDGLPTPQRYWAMLALAIGITIAVLDGAIANIALPTIARELHVAPAESIWVINAYQLAIVALLLPLAALGERIGYRRVYLSGVAIFTVGSLACALSQTLAQLVAARVFQGIGAAGIMGVNGALVRFTFPHASLGRGVGLNALMVSTAAAIGPTVASGILAIGPWEWLFAVNVPIGLFNLVFASRVLPYSPLSERPIDWTSAALNAAAFGLFFISVDTFTHGGGAGAIAALEFVSAIVAGTLLVRREAGEARPLIPIDLLRFPVFRLSVFASIFSFAAYTLAFLVLPFYFQSALHRDQVQTGLLMTPWPLAIALIAPMAGRLADRVPAALLGGIGLLVMALGLFTLTTMSAESTTLEIVWRVVLCGLGFGLFQAPNSRTMLGTAPRDRAGAASGMQATARLIGQTGGATLVALIFRLAPNHAELIALWIGVCFAVSGAGLSVMRWPAQRAALAAAAPKSGS